MDVSQLKDRISELCNGATDAAIGTPLDKEFVPSLFEREEELALLEDRLSKNDKTALKSELDGLNKTFEKARQQEQGELKKIDEIDGLWFDCKVSDNKRKDMLNSVNPVRFDKRKNETERAFAPTKRKIVLNEIKDSSSKQKTPDIAISSVKTTELKK